MKVALVGASGNAGSRILAELVSRGHEVTAIARNVDKIEAKPGVTVIQADADDPAALADAIKGHDVAISSLKFSASDAAKLIEAARASGVGRYIVVGGAASLKSPGSDQRIIDSGQIPEAFMPEIRAGANFLERLKQEPEGLDWTFVSPSMVFGPGERTGVFRLGTEELLIAADGKSSISYEDFAVALVDEIEAPKHNRGRFTVGY
ncbi:MAG: NAD(P)-dependent oxidoreductase [Sphingomonas bacterium]|nr:NAD(P)H-binding protein [Sphingomonas bacterium]MDB5688516.1 NAD(P)-dependent oxidoreductase [Sphingomonas bacterium]